MFRYWLLIAFVSLSFLRVVGDEPDGSTPSASQAPADNRPTLSEQQLLDEISLIREKLGGSVLKNTALDKADDEAQAANGNESDFQAGVKSLMRKSAPNSAEVAKSQLPDLGPGCAGTTESPAAVPGNLIRTLRTRSAMLDKIANEMELRRQYTHADQIRRIANDLRQSARQLDSRPPRTASGQGSFQLETRSLPRGPQSPLNPTNRPNRTN